MSSAKPSTLVEARTEPFGENLQEPDGTTRGGLVDSVRPHEENSEHVKNSWKQRPYPTQHVRDESQLGWSRGRSHKYQNGDDDGSRRSHLPPGEHVERHSMAVKPAPDGESWPLRTDGFGDGHDDWKSQQKSLLEGVVDLTNTVDSDRDVQVATRKYLRFCLSCN